MNPNIHPELAKPHAASAFRGFMSASLQQPGGHVHPAFHEAENRGAESAVLRYMGERVMAEFVFNCRRHGVDPLMLNRTELVDGIDNTLKGMVNADRDQYATTSHAGFRAMYKQARHEFKAIGEQLAEAHTQRLIESLQAVQSSKLMRPADRAEAEGRILREACVAASAYRAAGRTPRYVVAMFRDNTDVAGSPLIKLIEQAVEDDGKVTMARRAGLARPVATNGNGMSRNNDSKSASAPRRH